MIDASTTLIRVVEQLTKITNSLEQMAAVSSKQSTYQSQADKYTQDYQKRQEAPQAEKDSKDTKTGFLKSLGDKIFGLTAPGTLRSNEQQRFTNIAKCFNTVMRVDAISKSIDRLRESNDEAAEQRKRESLFARLTPKATKAEDRAESKGSMLGSMLKWGAIAAALKLLWDLATSPLNALSGLSQFLAKWSVVGIIKLITFKVQLFFRTLMVPLQMLYKMVTGDAIEHSIKQLATNIGKWVTKFGSYISGAFTTMGDMIPKFLSNAEKYLIEKMPKLASNLSSIGSVLSESFDSIINWIKKPFENLTSSIVNFFSKKGGGEIAKVAATKLEGGILKKIFLAPLKFLGKLGLRGLKLIPGIGALISFYFAYDRYKQGDYTGAIVEIASGLASSIPGIGWALSMGIDMINVWRDLSGKTADETKKNGTTSNWFTKMIDGFGAWASNSLYDWPYVGSIVRSVEHFQAGRWKEGFTSMANAIPLVGSVLALFDIKETESQAGRGTGNFGAALKGAASWVYNSIRDIPVIGGVIKAIEQFASGNFSEGLSELGLGGIINAIKTFKFEIPSFGDVGDMLTKALEFLRDTIMDLPIIRNIIKSVQYAAAGQWEKSALELLPAGMVDWFKKITGKEDRNYSKLDQSLASKNVPQTKSFEQSFNNSKIAPSTQKLEFAGISELQQSLIDMSQQEINLLTEQRNLIKDTNTVLWMIYNNSTTSPNDATFQQPSPYSSEVPTGSPTSITRGAFNQGKNVMNMGMRQGTLG